MRMVEVVKSEGVIGAFKAMPTTFSTTVFGLGNTVYGLVMASQARMRKDHILSRDRVIKGLGMVIVGRLTCDWEFKKWLKKEKNMTSIEWDQGQMVKKVETKVATEAAKTLEGIRRMA